MSSVLESENIDPSGSSARAPFCHLLEIRPIGTDDWSDVRYVHDKCIAALAAPLGPPDIAGAFTSFLGEAEYVDPLHARHLVGAWIDGQLVGTIGWRLAADRARVAQIEGLFVLPLFASMGIGSALLAHAEERARRAGSLILTAMATSTSASFFELFGYHVGDGTADESADRLDDERALRVVFMRKEERTTTATLADSARAGARRRLAARKYAGGGSRLGGAQRRRALINDD